MRLQATKASVTSGGSAIDALYRAAGSKPTLDQRFAKDKSLIDKISGSNLITFNRASAGTYFGSDGLIKTSLVNLLTYSEQFDQWTVAANSIVTPNAIAAPDGTLTADKLYFATTGATNVSQSVTLIRDKNYTFSVYAKAVTPGSNNKFMPYISALSPKFPTNSFEATSEWVRFSFTFTHTNSTGSIPVFILNIGDQYITNVYFWGAQLEEGTTTANDYIPTGSTISGAPRFDHDPVTGESLGLLIEEERTNLFLNSGTLSTQSVTSTAIDYALSFYGTGTVTLSGSATGFLAGTGANERVSLIVTATAGTITATVAGTVENGQLEAGSSPSSYIPTSGSTATRSPDIATIGSANFSSWYNQSEGTIFANSSDNSGKIVVISDGTDSNKHELSITSTDVTLSQKNSDSNQVSLSQSRSSKSAFAYAADDYGLSVGGAAAVTDTSATPPTVNKLSIGCQYDDSLQLNGHIKRLAFFSTRKTDEELTKMTS